MTDVNIEQVLNQMRVLSQAVKPPETSASERPDFARLLADSLRQVNDLQQEAGNLQTAFELDDPNVDLPEVMIALQKASVSFQAVTQVRNRLLSAYQEIMNMQV